MLHVLQQMCYVTYLCNVCSVLYKIGRASCRERDVLV